MVQTRSQAKAGTARRPAASPLKSSLKGPARRGRKPAAQKQSPSAVTEDAGITVKPVKPTSTTTAAKAKPTSTILRAGPRRSPKKAQIRMPPKSPVRRGRPPLKAKKQAPLETVVAAKGTSPVEDTIAVMSKDETPITGPDELAAPANVSKQSEEPKSLQSPVIPGNVLRMSNISVGDSLLALPPKSPIKSPFKGSRLNTPLFSTPSGAKRLSPSKLGSSRLLFQKSPKSPPKVATPSVENELALQFDDIFAFENVPMTTEEPTLSAVMSATSPTKSPWKDMGQEPAAPIRPSSPIKSALKSPTKAAQPDDSRTAIEDLPKSPSKTVTFENIAEVSPARSIVPEAVDLNSITTDNKRAEPEEPPQPLKGAVFFLDINSAGKDAGDIFRPLLTELGAECVETWYGTPREVTHVLFKDGDRSTLEKVLACKGEVKCVNLGWALDCERYGKWVDETDYAVDLSVVQSSPKRPLSIISGNVTPMAPRTPGLPRSSRTAAGTPFTLSKPKPLATPPSMTMADDDKENVPTPEMYDSPNTPYFLHRSTLVQRTCPPKQVNRPLFAVTPRAGPLQDRLQLARRKSFQYAPQSNPSPLRLGYGLF